MSAIGVRVNFRNANGDGDIYIVEDLTTDGDYVIFSWELTRKVTAYKGNVSFVVCAVKSATDGTIKNEWNTTLNKECEVFEGLEVTEQIEQENPDIIEYILANLGGSVSAEQIAQAVEAYMKEHPFTETDPTVPRWAKQTEKPSYTAEEVGALPVGTKIPSKTSDLQNDSGYAKTTDIPDKLPNPQKLTFSGAVTAEYDGSGAVTVTIPSGGASGGGSAFSPQLIAKLVADGTTTSILQDIDVAYPGIYTVAIIGSHIADTENNGQTLFAKFGASNMYTNAVDVRSIRTVNNNYIEQFVALTFALDSEKCFHVIGKAESSADNISNWMNTPDGTKISTNAIFFYSSTSKIIPAGFTCNVWRWA